MAAPSITIQLIDPGSLATPTSTDQIPLYIGVSNAGDLGEIQEFARPDLVAAEYEFGHLVDVASHALALGASSVRCLRIAATVAGDVTPLESDPTLLVDDIVATGTGYLNDLRVRVQAVTGTSGAVSAGAVKVRYSLDAWDLPDIDPTWSGTITVPANGRISVPHVGLRIDLDTAQTPEAGDEWTGDVTAAHYASTEVAALLAELKTAQAGPITCLVFCGDALTASAANTLAQAYASLLGLLFADARFVGALAGASKDTDTAIITATASTTSDPPWLGVGYGTAYVTASTAAVGRGVLALREHEVVGATIAQLLVSTDPGRTASGALPRVVATDYDAADHGEALHDARIAALRSWEPALRGLYVQRQRLLAPTPSNYVSWQHAAIMIVACRIAHRIAALTVLENMRTVASGAIDPRDATDVETAIRADLVRTLMDPTNARGTRGHVSAVGVAVDRVIALPAMAIDVRIRPLGYVEDLDVRLQYAGEV